MTSHPCQEWRGDVAALAIGRIDAEDRPRVQAHVDGCAACRAALAELRRTVATLPLVDPDHLTLPPAPPPDLADRIVRQMRDERRVQRARRRHRSLLGALAGAAAAVVLVAVVVVGRDDNPAAHNFALEAPGVEATFTLQANGEGTAVRLSHQGLDPDDVYWLWLTDASGQRVSAGTFHGSTERSSLILQSAMAEDDTVRIWVTDEADGIVLDATL